MWAGVGEAWRAPRGGRFGGGGREMVDCCALEGVLSGGFFFWRGTEGGREMGVQIFGGGGKICKEAGRSNFCGLQR